MSRRSKREMAPPPHQTGAPSPYQGGSASAPPPLSSTLNSNDLKVPSRGGQSAWWPVSLPPASGVTSPNFAMDLYPPGGFMSYFQTGQQPFIPPHIQFQPPWPSASNEIQSAPPSNDLGIQDAKAKRKGKPIINIDDGNDVRTAKRLVFEPDEDLRLVLRDEPKWHAILEDLHNPNKRRVDDGDERNDILGTPDADGEKERPIGTKAAKKQRSGKGRAKDDDAILNKEMKKYMDIQAAATKRHEEFLETQQRVSVAKVEAARLRRESVLLETYQKMITMDTKGMTDEMKAEHTAGLKIMRDKMVSNIN